MGGWRAQRWNHVRSTKMLLGARATNRSMALTPAACHLHLHPCACTPRGPPSPLPYCQTSSGSTARPSPVISSNPAFTFSAFLESCSMPTRALETSTCLFSDQWSRALNTQLRHPEAQSLKPKPTKNNKTPYELRAARIKKAHCTSAN